MKSNANEVALGLERIKSKIERQTEDFLTRMVREGRTEAEANLSLAKYAGSLESGIDAYVKDGIGYVSLVGEDAGFIEFGAGVTYWTGEYSHPLEGTIEGTYRGSYGEHHGYDASWKYKGEVGTAPSTYRLKDRKGNPTEYVITRGNPANRVIYNTGKELEKRMLDIAKEVFK